MSTVQKKRKPITPSDDYFDGYIVGNTFEEICDQEMAAHDRYVMKQAMEMSRPKVERQQKPKLPK